ncbi:ACT domain-containing protein [Candidatus Woesearchaeota archaeon]|nr:ACT domain-containing protein [Candidatus Woesearchaeota archaeon]
MSIQKDVEAFIREQPAILEALEQDLLNYSALVRKVIKETSLKQKDFDAILVAIRRFRDKTQKNPKQKRDIRQLLRESTIEVRNRRAVVILDKDAPLRLLNHIIERVEREQEHISIANTAHAVTVITHERFLPLFVKLDPYIRKRTEDLAGITIHSPENLEEVPGVIAYLTNLLAGKGVNVVELTSCYTDTIIIVARDNFQAALDILHF